MLQESGIGSGDMQSQMFLDPTDVCHDQIASKLGIPKQYYEKLNADNHRNCLDSNVNHWLRHGDVNYFVRTFIDVEEQTGIIRALLSDRFKVIDNWDVLMAALGAIKETGVQIEVQNADLTDKKMYVRFIAPHVTAESPKLLSRYRLPNSDNTDNGIVAGFVLTNSETGNGGFSIMPRLMVKVCSNGMIVQKDAYKKVHLGGKMEEYSEIKWSEETTQKNMELIISQTKDAVRTFLSQEY